MISTKLANIADHCLTWAARNERMAAAQASHLATVLLSLSRQVQALERAEIVIAALETVDGD